MKIRRLRTRLGFTLVEIMVAMALVGATGVSILGAFSNSSLTSDAPENAAYYLAAQQLARLNEAVRADWWAANGQPLSLNSAGPQPAAETLNSSHSYSPSYTVNPSGVNWDGAASGASLDGNGDGSEDYRRVRMVVSWT